MKKLPGIVIPLIALAIGLIIGFGVSQIQMKKEQKIFQDKIKEANRKIAFIQKKMTEEKTETAASMEQQFQSDLDKLQNEKKALGGQLGELKDQMQKLDMKVRESEEAVARAKKESGEASARAKKELQEMERNNKDLDHELTRITGEKQTIQAELKKATQDLAQCVSNNAELCIIAEELVERYRKKGLGAALMEREPLTQVRKVELEQLTQKYREEIEQQKIKRKDARGKNAAE
jgi:predicted  nucleic acid-binding Zn-ribbon protein